MEIKINSIEEFENEVLKSKETILVDFYAEWCGPCKMMMPVLEKFTEKTKIKVAKINIDENPDLTINYGVMSVPTFIAFKDGKKIKETVGYQSPDEIEALFK